MSFTRLFYRAWADGASLGQVAAPASELAQGPEREQDAGLVVIPPRPCDEQALSIFYPWSKQLASASRATQQVGDWLD